MGESGPLVVFIGHDSREPAASYVAAHSILRRTKTDTRIYYLKHRELRQKGLFKRPWIINDDLGEWTDVLDGKTFSTEFSHTRFLVPRLMNYKGWALFIDADMIFLSDVAKVFEMRDNRFAVMCVKHNYPPRRDDVKMDGRTQRFYHRKNWSSFVLWNCNHPANKQVTSELVNFLPGRDLHSFSWLEGSEIGSLPPTYNYIAGISKPLGVNEKPDVIHYSDGGPWFDECQDVPFADLWTSEYESWQRDGEGNKFTDIPTTKFEL